MSQDDTPEIEAFRLRRTGARPIEFEGTLIAEVQTYPDRNRRAFSGKVGCSDIASAFRTTSGKLVLALQRESYWTGEQDTHEVHVYTNDQDLLDDLPKRLPPRLLDRILEQLEDEMNTAEILE